MLTFHATGPPETARPSPDHSHTASTCPHPTAVSTCSQKATHEEENDISKSVRGRAIKCSRETSRL